MPFSFLFAVWVTAGLVAARRDVGLENLMSLWCDVIIGDALSPRVSRLAAGLFRVCGFGHGRVGRSSP